MWGWPCEAKLLPLGKLLWGERVVCTPGSVLAIPMTAALFWCLSSPAGCNSSSASFCCHSTAGPSGSSFSRAFPSAAAG